MDDTGHVCTWEGRDPITSCCISGKRYDCEGCDAFGCCNVFENCVSCCLGNAHGSNWEEVQRKVYGEVGMASNTKFDHCLHLCRTRPTSTIHENTYLGPRRFCYESKDNRRNDDRASGNANASPSSFVVGATGQNCHDACKKLKKSCVDDALVMANTCEAMREHFHCPMDCTLDRRLARPAFTPITNPRGETEYSCVLGQSDALSCLDMSYNSERLCVCE